MSAGLKLALLTAATAIAGAATTTNAYAGSNVNGPQLTGVAVRSFEADRPVVTAVSVRSGETARLNTQPKR